MAQNDENGNHAATPGPWRDVAPNRTDGPVTTTGSHLIMSGNVVIARVYGDTGLPVKDHARLIAEAPETAQERGRLKAINAELVEALDTLLNETVTVLTKYFAQPRHDMIEDVPSIAIARAALAKARE